jgi:cation transport ATPase
MTQVTPVQSMSKLSTETGNIVLPLHGLHCASCVRKVEQALKPFANTVKVTLDPMQVELTGLEPHASFEAMAATVAELGDYRLELGEQSIQTQTPVPDVKNPITVESGWLNWFKTYQPLLLIVAFILGASVLVQLGQHAQHDMGLSAVSGSETMRYFMAGFFLVFAFFKLLDLRAFADAYAGYDLLSARWHGWGYVYPFVELALGMAYLSNFQPVLTAWVTLVVMGFSAVGVILAVMRQSTIRCACLGTVFQLPMSTVTIVEDVGMVAMAALMLLWM